MSSTALAPIFKPTDFEKNPGPPPIDVGRSGARPSAALVHISARGFIGSIALIDEECGDAGSSDCRRHGRSRGLVASPLLALGDAMFFPVQILRKRVKPELK
jgi:hypothetical protein